VPQIPVKAVGSVGHEQVSVDHVVLAVPDLAAAVRNLAGRGVACMPGGRHPANGTHNAHARIGPRMFLEVLAADPAFAADRRSARGAAIAAVERPTVHELILQEPDRTRMEALRRAYDLDEPRPGRRVNDDRPDVAWMLTSWRTRAGTALPDLVRWTTDPPVDGLPASNVLARLSWSHPDVDDVLAALAAAGTDEVEGTRGTAGLRLELVEATTGASLVAFDGHEVE
jgi:hypothetical protein